MAVVPPRPAKMNSNGPVPPSFLIPGSLIEANYYWGDISRDEVAEQMCNTADGTFMVRNATAKGNVNEPFTLTLRKGGCNKLIKIYAKDGKYGLMEPLQFNSVPELIQYYQLHSLAQFNRTLDITLKYPVLKHQPELEPSNDLLAHRRQLEVTIKRHNDRMNQFEKLHYTLTEITESQKLKQDALNAFKLTKEMYEEQFLRNNQHKNMVLACDTQKAYDNYELLKKRVRMYEERTRKIEEAIQLDQIRGREIQLKMNKMKQEIGKIFNHRDQLKKKLLESGESYQNVELILSGKKIISSESTPHEDERTWLIKCDRITAETMLAGKDSGTFLIRPRKIPNSYALSIVDNTRIANPIVHCKIDEKESGFGFDEPFYIHETLRDLVMHHKETSLAEHNDTLNTQLMYPVLQSSFYATHVTTTSYQNVELILSGKKIISSESTPHEDERTWLINCDRITAETMLAGKESGTFLIRPRKIPNSYVLSIVDNTRIPNPIVHCKIDETESGFGFDEPFYIHETLRDLVMHHKETSLAEHNDTLNTQLMYPVLQSSFYATHVTTMPRDAHSRSSDNAQEPDYVH